MISKISVATLAVVAFAAHIEAATLTNKTTSRSNSRGAAPRKKGRGRTAYRGPARQVAPTADRYREIQKALANRGYLKAEPNGVWDSASQDAMRAFQTDHKLDPTGKINAPSLIGLGLGPKHESPLATAQPGSETAPAENSGK